MKLRIGKRKATMTLPPPPSRRSPLAPLHLTDLPDDVLRAVCAAAYDLGAGPALFSTCRRLADSGADAVTAVRVRAVRDNLEANAIPPPEPVPPWRPDSTASAWGLVPSTDAAAFLRFLGRTRYVRELSLNVDYHLDNDNVTDSSWEDTFYAAVAPVLRHLPLQVFEVAGEALVPLLGHRVGVGPLRELLLDNVRESAAAFLAAGDLMAAHAASLERLHLGFGATLQKQALFCKPGDLLALLRSVGPMPALRHLKLLCDFDAAVSRTLTAHCPGLRSLVVDGMFRPGCMLPWALPAWPSLVHVALLHCPDSDELDLATEVAPFFHGRALHYLSFWPESESLVATTPARLARALGGLVRLPETLDLAPGTVNNPRGALLDGAALRTLFGGGGPATAAVASVKLDLSADVSADAFAALGALPALRELRVDFDGGAAALVQPWRVPQVTDVTIVFVAAPPAAAALVAGLAASPVASRLTDLTIRGGEILPESARPSLAALTALRFLAMSLRRGAGAKAGAGEAEGTAAAAAAASPPREARARCKMWGWVRKLLRHRATVRSMQDEKVR